MQPPADEAERLIRDYLARAGFYGPRVVALDLRWFDGAWVARCVLDRRSTATAYVEVREPRTPYEREYESPFVVRQRLGFGQRGWPPHGSVPA